MRPCSDSWKTAADKVKKTNRTNDFEIYDTDTGFVISGLGSILSAPSSSEHDLESNIYDVTFSGSVLSSYAGSVGLRASSSAEIEDDNGVAMTDFVSSVSEFYDHLPFANGSFAPELVSVERVSPSSRRAVPLVLLGLGRTILVQPTKQRPLLPPRD